MNIRESRQSRGNSISLTPEMNNDLLGGETENTNSAEVTSGGRYNAQAGDDEDKYSGAFSARRLRHVTLAVVGVCGLSFGVALGYAAFSASDSDNDTTAYNSETEQGGFIETVLLRNSVPLTCDRSEPQAPRDVTRGSPGLKSPRGVMPMTSCAEMDLVNFHFHLGAEHRSEGQYDVEQGEWDGTGLRPGYFCNSDFGLDESANEPYNFQFCDNVQVGNTYEVHWVHSTGGDAFKTDGLNGAFSRKNNPIVAVESQAIKIVNHESYSDFSLDGMLDSGDVALYLGSTTGPSYSNEICSAFQVNWLVDRDCKAVSASAFDNVCRRMVEFYGMSVDIAPQSARVLVAPEHSSTELYDRV